MLSPPRLPELNESFIQTLPRRSVDSAQKSVLVKPRLPEDSQGGKQSEEREEEEVEEVEVYLCHVVVQQTEALSG